MAKVNLIRGTISGRFGAFVGSKWRGRHYVKLFGEPGNPRTPRQVAVRTVFKHLSSIATALSEGVLKPYTFPKPRRLTAYNRMIQINRPMFLKGEFDPAELKIFDGPLYSPGITDAVHNGNSIIVSFLPNTPDGPGAEDTAVCVIISDDGSYVRYGTAPRDAGSIFVSLATVPNAASIAFNAYLAFSRAPLPDTAEKGMVSVTTYSIVA
jgi:hypothetical protein